MRSHRAVTPFLVIALSIAALPAAGQPWQGSAVLAVRVTDDDGAAVEGAKVFARLSEGDPDSGPPAVETSVSGEATLPGLADGEWFVEISHEGFMLYTAYVDLRAGKRPQVGFSSQVNTERSFTPMKVRFVKESPTFNRGSGQSRTAETSTPEVVREAPEPSPAEPPTVVRTQPKPPQAPTPEVVRPAPATPPPAEPAAEPEPAVPQPPASPQAPESPSQPTPSRQPSPQPPAAPPAEPRPATRPQATPRTAEPRTEKPRTEAPEAGAPEAEVPATEAAAGTTPGSAAGEEPSAPESPAEDSPVTPAAAAPTEAEATEAPPALEAPTAGETPTPAAPSTPSGEPMAPAEEMPPAEPDAVETPARSEQPDPGAAPPPGPPTVAPQGEAEGEVPRAPSPEPAVEPPPQPAAAPTETPGGETGEAPAALPPASTEPVAPETTAPPARDTGAAGAAASPPVRERETAPPAPESSAAAPATGSIPRYLRSAAAGSCSECEPGEWAVTAEQTAARSGDGPEFRECPGSFEDDARAGARLIADAPAARLEGYAGPILTALFRIAPGAERSRIQDLLAPLAEPESYCQLAGVVLPRSASFSGYVLEAWDSVGGRSCQGSVGCAVGQARWLSEPIIVEGRERTVVYDIFKNRSSRRDRQARMTIYFQPPAPDWSPAR